MSVNNNNYESDLHKIKRLQAACGIAAAAFLLLIFFVSSWVIRIILLLPCIGLTAFAVYLQVLAGRLAKLKRKKQQSRTKHSETPSQSVKKRPSPYHERETHDYYTPRSVNRVIDIPLDMNEEEKTDEIEAVTASTDGKFVAETNVDDGPDIPDFVTSDQEPAETEEALMPPTAPKNEEKKTINLADYQYILPKHNPNLWKRPDTRVVIWPGGRVSRAPGIAGDNKLSDEQNPELPQGNSAMQASETTHETQITAEISESDHSEAASEQEKPVSEEAEPLNGEPDPSEEEMAQEVDEPLPAAEEPAPTDDGPVLDEGTESECDEPNPLEEELEPEYSEPVPVEEEPEPEYSEPVPVEEESEPGYDEPVPVEEEPEPEYSEPVPVEEESEPGYDEPVPVEEELEPEYSEPVPVEEEPEPEYSEPVPVEEESEPEYSEPVPVEEEPEPEYSEPVPVEEELEPEYSEPVPVEEESEPEYSEPVPVEEKSEPGYDEPVPVEEELEPEYSEPVPVEEKPEETLGEALPADSKADYMSGVSSAVIVLPSSLEAWESVDEPQPVSGEEKADEDETVTDEFEIEDPDEIQANNKESAVYQCPPLDLLLRPAIESVGQAETELRNNAERLADTLKSFGVEATAGDVARGPSVTRYEFTLERGVKLSKVTNLQDDIALALGATGVRIAPIPEKMSVVGIEVPNRLVTSVPIRKLLESPEFTFHKSHTAFALGEDISGNRIVGDISKFPHVLIAGTTGSGKSVCTNSLIISILYKSSPEEVRFIMVDPKMVELAPYNGIPHLLIPVVTDPKKATGALQWAVYEMMKRYRLFSDLNIKDLSAYNELAKTDHKLKQLPTIVIVIDELADLMLIAAKEVDESICRIAQMGRAAGMHLVIATQSPRADVITGLMKANIPSRIAFAVASSLESRIILDTVGAEKLVGKGDMLYRPIGMAKPRRVQGCFISSGEIEQVVTYLKANGETSYDTEVIDKIEQTVAENETKERTAVVETQPEDEDDELLKEAVDVILETGQASVSMLQRRLKLGYSRAARMIDRMEEMGIVGQFEGSKPRKILITRESWQSRNIPHAAE